MFDQLLRDEFRESILRRWASRKKKKRKSIWEGVGDVMWNLLFFWMILLVVWPLGGIITSEWAAWEKTSRRNPRDLPSILNPFLPAVNVYTAFSWEAGSTGSGS